MTTPFQLILQQEMCRLQSLQVAPSGVVPYHYKYIQKRTRYQKGFSLSGMVRKLFH